MKTFILCMLLLPSLAFAGYRVEWEAPPDDDLAGFRIYQDGVVIADISDPAATSQVVLAPEGEYVIEMTAYDQAGNESARSAPERHDSLPPGSPVIRLIITVLSQGEN